LKEGLSFIFRDEKLFYFMLLGALVAIFVWPYQALMPVVAERVFSSGPAGLGTLLSAAGAGSLAGAVFVSARSKNKQKAQTIFLGVLVGGVSLVLFSFNRNFWLAHLILFVAGFGVITAVSLLNTLVQLSAPDQMRGRIMAVYLTMFVGMMPLGNALLGTIAEKTSVLFALGLGAVVVLFSAGLIYFTKVVNWQQ
jgi:predicted MFS family arabinose efflux permease